MLTYFNVHKRQHKSTDSISAQICAALNNILRNSGRNVILTGIGCLYEYYLKKGKKYL